MRSALLLFLTASLALAARLPVAFEPNRGQEPGPAEFIVHTSGAALTLRAGRAEWISRQARVAVVFESAPAARAARAKTLCPAWSTISSPIGPRAGSRIFLLTRACVTRNYIRASTWFIT
jgi:hypothetical protein